MSEFWYFLKNPIVSVMFEQLNYQRLVTVPYNSFGFWADLHLDGHV